MTDETLTHTSEDGRFARVREIHYSEISNEYGALECRLCREPWPCETIQAIDDPADSTVPSLVLPYETITLLHDLLAQSLGLPIAQAAREEAADRITLDRNSLAALLAHHADVLAARWDAAVPDPASYSLRLHAGELTGDEETPFVAELLDNAMAFPSAAPSAVPAAPAYRASVLREAADDLEAWEPTPSERWSEAEQARHEDGIDAAADRLRRLADEAQQPEAVSPAYARLQVAAKEAAEAAHLHAMRGMRAVYQLCRQHGFGDQPIPAAEVLAALGLDENANTVEAEGAQR